MHRLYAASIVALMAGVMVSLALGASGTAAAGRWVITNLGTLGGRDDASEAVAINGKGEVIGSSYTGEGIHGFIWRNGKMLDLGPGEAVAVSDRSQVIVVDLVLGRRFDRYRSRIWEEGSVQSLPPLRGWWDSEAVTINDRGVVVGSSAMTPAESDNVSVEHAVMWQNGRITDLGTLGGTSSEATAINDQGQIVGWSTTKSGETHAFLWQQGKMTDLGVKGWNEGVAINDRGLVVGVTRTKAGRTHAYLWQNGRIRDLGTLGGAESEATAINSRGQIIGRSQVRRNLNHAFLWQSGTISDLGTRWATSINDRGQIVGSTGTKFGQTHAYLWQDGLVTDLGALRRPANDSEAVAINNQGQIVGTSDDRAVLWTWQPAK